MKTLLDFLREWLKWAKNPDVNPYEFNTYRGLCGNVSLYVNNDDDEHAQIISHLRKHLKRDYGLAVWSFDSEQSFPCNRHMNPLRLAWVEKTIKELESKV